MFNDKHVKWKVAKTHVVLSIDRWFLSTSDIEKKPIISWKAFPEAENHIL